mmetsp:Transcript_13896/g.32262  ORF Transcript_13896/g.32262 Transcript_13896/m.32262 type:complete len:211 (+) Transcript_13896:185-817(+)
MLRCEEEDEAAFLSFLLSLSLSEGVILAIVESLSNAAVTLPNIEPPEAASSFPAAGFPGGPAALRRTSIETGRELERIASTTSVAFNPVTSMDPIRTMTSPTFIPAKSATAPGATKLTGKPPSAKVGAASPSAPDSSMENRAVVNPKLALGAGSRRRCTSSAVTEEAVSFCVTVASHFGQRTDGIPWGTRSCAAHFGQAAEEAVQCATPS